MCLHYIGLDAPRIRSGFGALLGIVSFYILKLFSDKQKYNNIWIYKFFIFSICIYFVINVINYIDIISVHVKVNVEEESYGIALKKYLDEYEIKEDIEVKYIINVYDYDKGLYFEKMNRNCGPTQSAYACGWSSVQVVNFYINKNLDYLGEITSDMLDFVGDYKIIDDILYIKVHKF